MEAPAPGLTRNVRDKLMSQTDSAFITPGGEPRHRASGLSRGQGPAPTTADLDAFGDTLAGMGRLLADIRAEVTASKAARS